MLLHLRRKIKVVGDQKFRLHSRLKTGLKNTDVIHRKLIFKEIISRTSVELGRMFDYCPDKGKGKH